MAVVRSHSCTLSEEEGAFTLARLVSDLLSKTVATVAPNVIFFWAWKPFVKARLWAKSRRLWTEFLEPVLESCASDGEESAEKGPSRVSQSRVSINTQKGSFCLGTYFLDVKHRVSTLIAGLVGSKA